MIVSATAFASTAICAMKIGDDIRTIAAKCREWMFN
jgi:hypothetical protein